MISTLKKKLNKKGFTLAELLIVIAIIAILVAIAVPVFSAQLENSRKAVDRANARAANSLAVADALLNHPDESTAITYSFAIDDDGNIGILTCSAVTSCPGITATGTAVTGESTACSAALSVVVTNGAVTSNNWLAALNA